jgi:hypothetical protein
METLYIVNLRKDELVAAAGLSSFQAALLLGQLRADRADVTKDAALEAYMEQPDVQVYLDSLGMNYAWDGLWTRSFADGSRNPAFSVTVDFDAYTAPEPTDANAVALAQ